MRYSKLIFVLMLTLILVFGSSISAFATILPPVDKDLLMLDVEPNGSGTITGTSEGWYNDGTEISITAVPNTGYAFKYWDVEIDGPGNDYTSTNINLIFNITKNTKCTAYFEKTYHLNVSVYSSSDGMGTVSGTGDYKKDDMVPVQAYPNDGYRFVKWIVKVYDRHPNEEDLTPSQPSSFDYKMPDKNVDLFAVFAENPDLTILVDPSEPAIGEVTGAITGKVLPGTSITLTGNPTVRGAYFNGFTFNPEITLTGTTPDSVTFVMPDGDLEVTAHFGMYDLKGVRLVPSPADKGNPALDENALTGPPDFDGYYYYGETYNVIPNPIENWRFVGYNWKCVSGPEPEVAKVMVALESSPYMSVDPDYDFSIHGCNTEITVYYEEDPYIMATVKYQNQSGGTIRPDDSVKIYLNDPYSITQPNITGYVNPGSVASGVVTDVETELVIIFKYDVPQVITNTVTETVVVTQTVTVPATTAPTTEAVIPEEETPLGAAMIGFNFDEILEPVPVVEEAPEELLPVEETPLGDALPQTGQIPADLFYGIGGLVSAMGVYLKRRK